MALLPSPSPSPAEHRRFSRAVGLLGLVHLDPDSSSQGRDGELGRGGVGAQPHVLRQRAPTRGRPPSVSVTHSHNEIAVQ